MAVARRGAEEAGAIFVLVEKPGRRFDLYGPAPQAVFQTESASDRLFSLLASDLTEPASQARLEQEIRFDPDLWIVEITDRQGRAFLDLAPLLP